MRCSRLMERECFNHTLDVGGDASDGQISLFEYIKFQWHKTH